jgi:hypothetical protein
MRHRDTILLTAGIILTTIIAAFAAAIELASGTRLDSIAERLARRV